MGKKNHGKHYLKRQRWVLVQLDNMWDVQKDILRKDWSINLCI